MNPRDVDVRALPDWGFGRMTIFWGNLGFMLIEGLGFVALFGAYGFLASQDADWPLVRTLPNPIVGTWLAIFLIASEIPNTWLKKRLHAQDRAGARIGTVLMALVGMGALAIRAFEFRMLNVSWGDNAFGSMVWALLVLHTSHLIADVGETCVLTVMALTSDLPGPRLVDLEEDAEYWDFVVLTWLPVYAVIYWVTRWIAT